MRIFRSTTSDQNANTYVGPFGEIVVGDNGLLLIQNNVTPGGTTITVEPATPTALGGVKLGDGFVLNANNQVTTSMLYSTDSRMWVDSAGAYIATDYNATANQWTFDNEGALIFPGNTLVVGAGNVVNFIGSTDTPLVTFSTGPDSFSQFGWQNSSVSPSNISGIQTDATGVRIGTGAPNGGGPIYQGNIGWTFGADGITTFPNNILQAPDGSTLEIKTTSGNVYSVFNAYNTFTNIGIEDDTTGPNPAWAYLETSMSNVNTPKATVIVRAADTGIGMRWTFSADGNLTIPGNIQTISTGFPFSSNISVINTPGSTVIVTLTGSVFGAAETGQVTISGVVGMTQANDTWYYASIDPSNFVLYNDAALTNPVNGNTWTAYSSGGIAVSQGYSNVSITGGHVNIVTNTGNTWTFGSTGNLTLPVGGTINFSDGSNALVDGSTVNTGNVTFSDINVIGTGNLHLQPDSNNAGAYLDIYLTAGPDIHIAGNGETVILGRDSGANVKVGVDGNVSIQADSGTAHVWTFGNNGNIVLPETASILSDNVMTLQSGDTLFLRSNLGGVGIYSGNSQLSTTSGLGIEAYADSINFTPNAEGDVLIDINNANTFVEISGPAGSWIFAGDGNLTLPAGGGIVNNGNTWTFGEDGVLTLPGGSAQIEVESDYGVRIGTAALNVAPSNHIKVGGSNAFEIFGGPPGYSWTFGSDGNLTFPTGNLVITDDNASLGNAAVISSADHNLTMLSTGVNGGTSSLWIEDYTSIGTSNIAAVYSNPVPGSKIVRVAVGQNGGAGPKLWDFDNTGNLTLPAGGTVSYTPATASDWSNPPPTTIESALDRLAAVVKVLNGGTGA